MTGSRLKIATLMGCVIVAATACSSTSDGGASSTKLSLEDQAIQQLSPLAGVASVVAQQSAVSDTTDDRADPDLWTLDIDVTMAGDVGPDEASAAAKATRAFASDHVGSARWTARLRIGAEVVVPDEDRTTPSPVQIEIYPTVRTSAAEDARDAMMLKQLDDVASVAITDAALYVQVARAEDLSPVIDQLRKLPIWRDGGSLHTDTGRVKLADVPARIALSQTHAFFAAAVRYPGADFAIESSGQSPDVFVNRVTPEQATQIASAWTEPYLAATGPDGFVLEFSIRAADADQTIDSHGTFGVLDPDPGADSE